jgi:hypothetical protein
MTPFARPNSLQSRFFHNILENSETLSQLLRKIKFSSQHLRKSRVSYNILDIDKFKAKDKSLGLEQYAAPHDTICKAHLITSRFSQFGTSDTENLDNILKNSQTSCQKGLGQSLGKGQSLGLEQYAAQQT